MPIARIAMRALQFIVWFFVVVSSVLGGAVGLSGLSQVQMGSSSAAPLEGVAALMCIFILVGSVIVFVLCLLFRPSPPAFIWRNWVIAAGCYVLVLWVGFSVMSGRIQSSRYILTAHVLDSSGQPIPEASVRYQSFSLGEGLGRLDRLANGQTNTDSAGSVSIRANHAHRIYLDIQKEGFERMSFQLDAAGRRYPHQITSPEWGKGISVLRPPTARFEKQCGLLIPPESDITLNVTMQK